MSLEFLRQVGVLFQGLRCALAIGGCRSTLCLCLPQLECRIRKPFCEIILLALPVDLDRLGNMSSPVVAGAPVVEFLLQDFVREPFVI